MHSLVRPILLRRRRPYALMLNPEAQPPDAELREAMQAGVRERNAVVGADRQRQPVFAERAFKASARPGHAHRSQGVHANQVTGVLVGDRERVAVDPVPRLEVSFEVRSPEIIRRLRDRSHGAGMLMRAAAPSLLHQTFPAQEIAHRACCRPLDAGVLWLQPADQ